MEHYLELIFFIPDEQSEIIQDHIFELGALGIEESMSDPGQYTAYFHESAEDSALIALLLERHETAGLKHVTTKRPPIQNWQENWKENFKPIHLGRNLVIRPPWEAPEPDRIEVVINPGQGFGTGYHESTRLCLESLEEIYQNNRPQSLIDVGAGSGILTIAALKMGAEIATCLEIEQEALDEIPQNLKLSGLEPSKALCLFGGPECLQEPAPLVVANIVGEVLLALADDLERLSQDHLLLSGIVADYLDPLLKRFDQRFELVKHWTLKEWNALHFRRKA